MDSQFDDFKSLRRLLALKRHEQPPPGYFETLSRQISFRVQAGETVRETIAERLNAEAPWLKRLLEMLIAQPQRSGAIAAGACAAILGVVLFFQLRPASAKGVSQASIAPPVADQPSLVFNLPLIQPEATALTNGSLLPNIPEGLFGAPGISALPVSSQPKAVWPRN